MKCCINGVNFIRLLLLLIKLLTFEIQKCAQILCAHKTCFLMLGHIFDKSFKMVSVRKKMNKYYCTQSQYHITHTINNDTYMSNNHLTTKVHMDGTKIEP